MCDSETQAGPKLPKLLLLLTPSHSGSTAMAAFMAQSDAIAGLQARYEGQWLSEHLSDSDRWDPGKICNYGEIYEKWRGAAHSIQKRHPNVRYIIEKSPPNLVRYKAIRAIFEESSVVVNIRNPYAQVSSIAHRQVRIDDLPGDERRQEIRRLAKRWVWISSQLRETLEEEGFATLSYESFCSDPCTIFRKFGINGLSVNMDSRYAVKVKDYAQQPIQDMNTRQIQRLRPSDIEEISDVVRGDSSLLSFFGYDLI